MESIIYFAVKDPRLVSNNDMYMHPVRKTKRGTYVSYFCKSPSLKELSQFYEEVLSTLILEESIEFLKKEVSDGKGINLKLEIGMPRNELYEHDVSNYIKAIEDCITNRTGVDDRYNLTVSISKSIILSTDWVLKVTISSQSVEIYQNQEDFINGVQSRT